jgi:hypothetical protein
MTGRRRTGRHNSRRRWTVTDASPSISPALRIKRKDRGTGSQSGSQTAQPTLYDHGRARSTDRSFEREGRPAGPVRTLSRDLHIRRSAPGTSPPIRLTTSMLPVFSAGSLPEPLADSITSRCQTLSSSQFSSQLRSFLPFAESPSRLLRSLQTARTLVNSGGGNLESGWVRGSSARTVAGPGRPLCCRTAADSTPPC